MLVGIRGLSAYTKIPAFHCDYHNEQREAYTIDFHLVTADIKLLLLLLIGSLIQGASRQVVFHSVELNFLGPCLLIPI